MTGQARMSGFDIFRYRADTGAMNVSLTPKLEKLIQEKVASGRYTTASEVVREALRLLEEQEELRKLRVATVRERIAEGIVSADAGELYDGKEVFGELKKRSRARRGKRK